MLDFKSFARENLQARHLVAILQRKFNLLGAQQLLLQIVKVAVEEHAPVVDDHDPAAKLFDVVQVVRRQQNRGVKFAIDGAQEMPDVILGHHVEANRRLIEKQQRRIMQQRGSQIATHALAKRKLPHRRVQIIADPENFVEVLHPRVEIALRHIVNPPKQLERLDYRDVPPELRPLAEHHADRFHILPSLAEGNVTVDPDLSARRHQNAGEHLDGGRFAGAVRADVADHFAALDRKPDAVHRRHRAVITNEKILNRAPHPLPPPERAEVLAKIVYVDKRVGAHADTILTFEPRAWTHIAATTTHSAPATAGHPESLPVCHSPITLTRIRFGRKPSSSMKSTA